MKYQEFVIALGKRTHNSIEVRLDSGQPLRVAVDWQRLDALVDMFRRPQSRRRHITHQDLEVLGKMLGGILFAASAGSDLVVALSRGEDDTLIRIQLELDDPSLTKIPWEYAYHNEGFLALSKTTSIVRYSANKASGVAHTLPLQDDCLEVFNSTFERVRAAGQSTEAALTDARLSVSLLGHPLNVDWGLPALYTPAFDTREEASKPGWIEDLEEYGGFEDDVYVSRTGRDIETGYDEETAFEELGDFEEEAAMAEPVGDSEPQKRGEKPADTPWDVVPVFYGTNRKWQGGNDPEEVYSAERSASIDYGQVVVTIPKRRHVGEFNRPAWWKLEFRANPEKHIVLESVSRMNEEDWETAVKEKKTTENEAFLFVHGFKVTFAKAAMRTAQLALDLNGRNPGLTFMFSWPSKGDLGDYKADESTSIWAAADLQLFIEKLLIDLEIEKINIVAHSMGNRLLLDALRGLDTSKIPARQMEVIMAAPDVDAFHFKRVVGKLVKDGIGNYSLYASSEDKALKQSERMHDVARAGQGGKDLIVLDGMDSIDVSEIDTSLLGHSYYGDIQQVIMDMYHLIFNGLRANKRGLGKHQKDGLPFWRFRA